MSISGGPDIIENGLVLYLDAADNSSYISGSSTWYDISGNSNNGTLTNGPTFNSNNKGSIAFDGVDDYAGVGNLGSQFSNYTVEIWFKSDDVSNYRNPIDCNWLIYNGAYSNIGPRLEQNSSGNLVWVVGDTAGNYEPRTVISSGMSATPAHCALITKSGNLVTSYYNGVQVQSANQSYTHTGSFSNVQIGRGFSTSSERWFNGKIYSVKIYNRALSSNEILQNYNSIKGRYNL